MNRLHIHDIRQILLSKCDARPQSFALCSYLRKCEAPLCSLRALETGRSADVSGLWRKGERPHPPHRSQGPLLVQEYQDPGTELRLECIVTFIDLDPDIRAQRLNER